MEDKIKIQWVKCIMTRYICKPNLPYAIHSNLYPIPYQLYIVMFSPPVNLSVGQHAENRLVLSYLTAEAELECFDLSP